MDKQNTQEHEKDPFNLGKVIYCIHELDVQLEAERIIGRKLTVEELEEVESGIEWGIGTGLDIIYRTAIEEATGL